MYKLRKKELKRILAVALKTHFAEDTTVYLDLDKELIYRVRDNFVWAFPLDLEDILTSRTWALLPVSQVKQANKIILSGKHSIQVKASSKGVKEDSLWKPTELKVAVCALIVKKTVIGGKEVVDFLTVSRKDNASDLGLPGGKLEKGEDYFTALSREVLEETGYTINDDILEVYRNIDSHGFEVATFIATINDQVPRAELSASETGIVSWSSAEDLIRKSSFGAYNADLFASLGYKNGSTESDTTSS